MSEGLKISKVLKPFRFVVPRLPFFKLLFFSKLYLTFVSLLQWMKTWKIWDRKATGSFVYHVSRTPIPRRPRDDEEICRKIRSTFCDCGCGNTDSTLIRPRQKSNTSRKQLTFRSYKFVTGLLMRGGEYCPRWYVVKDEIQATTRSHGEQASKALRLLRAICTNAACHQARNGTLKTNFLSTSRLRFFRYATTRTDNSKITWLVKARTCTHKIMDSNWKVTQKVLPQINIRR